MSTDDCFEATLTLADGSVVSLELVTTVRDLQAKGHIVRVTDDVVEVVPPIDEDTMCPLDEDREGLRKFLEQEPVPGLH